LKYKTGGYTMITTRQYTHKDYDYVIKFLTKTYSTNQYIHSWLPARWAFAEYFVSPLYICAGYSGWHERVQLWEDNGELVAIMNSESPKGYGFIQINPEYRHLEPEMLDWAEKHLSMKKKNELVSHLRIWAHEDDFFREDLLKSRGFLLTDEYVYQTHQLLDVKLPETTLPDGYKICSFSKNTDVNRRLACYFAAFNPDMTFTPELVDDQDRANYKSLRSAPSYLEKFDLYSIFKDGTITSTALFWYDANLNLAVIEPVSTHPDHQRKGLATATILEGMKLLKAIGCEKVIVEPNGAHKYNIYKSMGFVKTEGCRAWVKKMT
jgi:predicted N-acetyltransferase YhbS